MFYKAPQWGTTGRSNDPSPTIVFFKMSTLLGLKPHVNLLFFFFLHLSGVLTLRDINIFLQSLLEENILFRAESNVGVFEIFNYYVLYI